MPMNKLLTILREICPDVAFDTEENLMDSGAIDSFDIVAIVGEIGAAYSIQVPVEEIKSENFNSAKAMLAMIERVKAEG